MESIFGIEPVDMSRCHKDRVPTSLYVHFAKWFLTSPEFVKGQTWEEDPEAEYVGGYPAAGLSTDRGVMPNAESALRLAALATAGGLKEKGLPLDEEDLFIKAQSRIRYLLGSHISGPHTCLDGLQWGLQGRSPRAVAMTALAAWLMLPDLDDMVARAISEMLVQEADRLVKVTPAEEASANRILTAYTDFLLCLSAASTMLPGHVHSDLWKLRLRHLAANRLSGGLPLEGDLQSGWVVDRTVGSDLTVSGLRGVDLAEWTECSTGLGQCAVPFLMKNESLPEELKWGVLEVWSALEKLLTWDGTPLCVQGTSSTKKELYFTAVIANSILLSHSPSAYLHDVYEAVSEKANLPVRDPFYFLLILFGGETAPVVPGPGFTQVWEGCFEFSEAGFCVHRTPTKMCSFSWKNSMMGLALPEFGGWLIHPENWSLVGKIEAQDCDNESVMLAAHTCSRNEDSFTVTADLRRCDNALSHRISFASLPNDAVVYLDSLLTLREVTLTRERVGVVSVLNNDRYGQMLTNERRLYSVDGEVRVVGVSQDQGRTLSIKGNWVNLDDQVGYVVFPSNQISYLDLNSYPLSEEGLPMDFGEKLVLFSNDHNKRFSSRQEVRRGMILVGLNQNQRQTRREAEALISVACPQDAAAALWSQHLVVANFSDFPRCLELYVSKGPRGEYTVFQGEQRITEDDVVLILHVEALSTRIIPALFTLSADSTLRVDITARGLDDSHLEMKNNTEGLIEVSAASISTALEGVFELLPGSRQVLRIGT